MRALVELVVLVSGCLSIFGYGYRAYLAKHAPKKHNEVDHLHHVEQLLDENKKIDEITHRIEKGEYQ